MQSVLITGASGGMGRAAVESFLASGHRVFALDIKAGEYPDERLKINDITKRCGKGEEVDRQG